MHWFKLWIKESYSIRQLTNFSGHSKSKLELIKNYWLNQEPQLKIDYSQYKYLLFDGTYFHKNGCLVILMDAISQKVIMNAYVTSESFHAVYPIFVKLKSLGLHPKSLIMDGHRKVMEAIHLVWPEILIQRCIYHILRQGLAWLRIYPKTQAARELRSIILSLPYIDTYVKRDQFLFDYNAWLYKYKSYVKSLPSSSVAFKDLKRTMSLITNAIPNMFHYLDDNNICSTTNILEGFFSRLKADYRKHRGLSEAHKKAFLSWYCYLKCNTF